MTLADVVAKQDDVQARTRTDPDRGRKMQVAVRLPSGEVVYATGCEIAPHPKTGEPVVVIDARL